MRTQLFGHFVLQARRLCGGGICLELDFGRLLRVAKFDKLKFFKHGDTINLKSADIIVTGGSEVDATDDIPEWTVEFTSMMRGNLKPNVLCKHLAVIDIKCLDASMVLTHTCVRCSHDVSNARNILQGEY